MLNYPTGMIGLPLRLLAREFMRISQNVVNKCRFNYEKGMLIQDIGFVQLKQCL